MARAPGTKRTASPGGPTSICRTPGGKRRRRPVSCSKRAGYVFDVAYTSVLTRAIRTLFIALDGLDLLWIPVLKRWQLNERHYGALQGLNKAETAAKHGDEQTKIWRRSYDIPPPPLTLDDQRHPSHDPRYAGLRPEGPAGNRVPEGHRRALPAAVARGDRAGDQERQARSHRRARQQPPRAGEVSRRHLGRRHRRTQHPDWHPAGLRARREAETNQELLPWRPRRPQSAPLRGWRRRPSARATSRSRQLGTDQPARIHIGSDFGTRPSSSEIFQWLERRVSVSVRLDPSRTGARAAGVVFMLHRAAEQARVRPRPGGPRKTGRLRALLRSPSLPHGARDCAGRSVPGCAAARGPLDAQSVLDVGCGTGAAGAAWALATGAQVRGSDSNPWAVTEAEWTYRTLGVSGTVRRGDVSELRLPSQPSTVLAAFVINELPSAGPCRRARTIGRSGSQGASSRGRRADSKDIDAVVGRVGARIPTRWAGRTQEWRFRVELPRLLRDLDKSAGLDHRELTARTLCAGDNLKP